MSRSVRCYSLALALLALPLAAVAEEASAAERGTAERVEVGQTAPDFTLPDPDGKELTASELRGEKNLLLVFFRGAW